MPGIVIPTEKLARVGVTPYQHQLEMTAEMCSTEHKKIYNASEMGCGKSAMAVMYANTMNCRNVLVVTVASARINWAREYQLWSVFNNMKHQAFAVLSGRDAQTLITKRAIHPGNLPSPVITSYEMIVSCKPLQKYVFDREWDLIIPDEFQKARSMGSQTATIMGNLLLKVPRAMALSGTPMCNGAIDLLPFLFIAATSCSKIHQSLQRPVRCALPRCDKPGRTKENFAQNTTDGL